MSKETVLPKNIRQIGEIQGDEKICLEDYVMTCIHKKEVQEKDGYLGIFFGEQQKTEDGTYVFIRGMLELPMAEDPEHMAEELKKRQTEYFPGWEVQGCCVIGQYPTERMTQMEDAVPGASQLIYHLQEQEETLYRMKNGRYQKIKGYIVFYEQNRKMQEYLEEEFKEDHVEKESLPDKAIKSFREKVRSKSEKRRGSMLKLASSFFVVTVLAASAVAVTRMDDIRRLRNVTDKESVTVENEAETEAGDRIYMKDRDDAISASASVQNDADSGKAASVQEEITSGEEAVQQNGIAPGEAAEMQSRTDSGEPGAEKRPEMQKQTEAQEMSDTSVLQKQVSSANEKDTGAAEISTDTENDYEQGSFAASAAARGIHASYTIRVGDTLADICNQYYGNLNKLESVCEVNGIADANRIMPGQKIVLP